MNRIGLIVTQRLTVLHFFYSIAILTSMAAMELGLFIFGFIGLFYLTSEYKDKNHTYLLYLSILCTLSFSISALLNSQDTGKILWMINNDRWIFLFPLLYLDIKRYISPLLVRKTILILAIVAAITGIYSVFQYFSGIDLIRGTILPHAAHYRGGGIWGSPMTHAHSSAVALFAALGLLAFSQSIRYRLILGMSSVFIIAGILATHVRGAWLGLVLPFFLIWTVFPRKIKIVSLLSSILFFTSLFHYSENFRARFMSSFMFNVASNQERFQIWKANWIVIQEKPFWGWGSYQNVDQLPRVYDLLGIENGFVGHAHNVYLQSLANFGIFGSILLLLLFLYIAWISFSNLYSSGCKERKALGLSAIASLIFIAVSGVSESNLYDREVAHILFFILALSCSVYKNSNFEEIKESK